MTYHRGWSMDCFDADWNSRTDGNRLWTIVDVDHDLIPKSGTKVILAIPADDHHSIGEAMLATVHDVRRPKRDGAKGWVVSFDWLPAHTCHPEEDRIGAMT